MSLSRSSSDLQYKKTLWVLHGASIETTQLLIVAALNGAFI
jgi:hypothetical protein